MERIKWCMHAKKGIELVDPNDNLSKAYVKKSEDSLKAGVALKQHKEWAICSSYYTMYFALYSILMKIGVKCEIHDCTIEFMKTYLSDYFSEKDYKFLKDSMNSRIDAQYYVDRTVLDKQYRKMLNEAPLFLVKCKEVLLKINENKILTIRNRIKKIKRQRFKSKK